MRERGPDAIRVIHIGNLTLGFNRLAIVGSAGATQPLESDATVCAINGEIYNYRELWRSLSETPQAATPDLTSDCSVLLPLVERNPSYFLHELDGIFAGALFNGKCLTLFRDHVGIKPMFYARPSFGTAFASTVAGLRPVVEPVVNRGSMRTYLEHGYVKTPATLLTGIYSVPAGATVSFQAPSAARQVRPWFDVWKYAADESHVRQFVESAVVSEIPDNWPVVSTLSGGIDSSLVTLLLHNAGAAPHALTVQYTGFEDDADLKTARRLCEDFGIKHIEVAVSPEDYVNEVLDVWRFDQPIADPNAISLNRLCQRTRQLGSRVLFTGDGADELFCGYSYYNGPAKGGLRGYLAAWTFNSMADNKDRLFVRRISGLPRPRRLRPSLGNPLRHVQEYDLRYWLEPNLLAKADRFGMADQVEVRVPFLRPALVATALTLPSHRKLKGGITKVALKAAFRDLLPRYVVERAKQGFPSPISEWLRGDAGRTLQASATWSVGDTWSVAKEQELWREHLSGEGDWGQQLWRLVVARAWWRSVFGS